MQARVTAEDKATIEAEARRLGLTVSEFLRLLARTYTIALERRES